MTVEPPIKPSTPETPSTTINVYGDLSGAINVAGKDIVSIGSDAHKPSPTSKEAKRPSRGLPLAILSLGVGGLCMCLGALSFVLFNGGLKTFTGSPTPIGGGGGKIAFTSGRDVNVGSDIYLMDSDGSNVVRL